MKTVRRSILILPLFFAALPCLAQSQSQDSSASAPASAKPAPAPAAAPSKATTATPEKKKPKKVWTNDNVGSIPGSVSVVGDASKDESVGSQQKNSSAGAGTAAADDVRQKQIDGYKDQIRQLQSQIDDADKNIAQLKNFKGENNSPSGGINMNQGYNMVPVEDQVKQLEDTKKKMQAKIEDVENEARKNGIDSGDLR
jgi:hypothetical protein